MWLGFRFVVCLNQQPLIDLKKKKKRKKIAKGVAEGLDALSSSFIHEGLVCRKASGNACICSVGCLKESTLVSQPKSDSSGLDGCHFQTKVGNLT